MRLLPRIGLLVIFFGAVGYPTGCWIVGAPASLVVTCLLCVVALVALLIYVAVTFSSRTEAQQFQASSAISREVDLAAVDFFFDSKGIAELSVAQALTFIDAVVYPRQVYRRISEHAEATHRSLAIKTTYTVSIDKQAGSDDDPDYVVPLFLFPKGEIQDGLKAYRGEDSRVSTLSTRDVHVFAAAVVRSLVFAAGTGAYSAYLGSLEKEVLKAIASPLQPSEQVLSEIRIRLLGLNAGSSDDGLLDTASAMVSELAKYHPICVPVSARDVRNTRWPWAHRLRLEYRTIPPLKAVDREPWWQRLADAVRLGLGVRLNRLFIPIPNAFRTNSYHLEVAGPQGTYLARQGTIPDQTRLAMRAHMQPRRGQRRAHLYVQQLDHNGEVLFATQFFERAPGSFAATTASAWAAAIVIGVLAIREGLNLPPSSGGVGALLPALLAVPIAVASWNRGLAQAVEHPSLLSRTLTFGTILVSLGAFAFAVVPGQVLSPGAIVWNLFAALALGLALVSTFSWFLRLAMEHHFSRSGDKEKLSKPRKGSRQ